jgi:glycosyltransferase involved in cell wall biosynthesis
MGAFLTSFIGYSPLVTMSWGSDLLRDGQRGLDRWLAEYTLKRSTVFICDCEAVAEVAYDLGMSKERTVIFPWGVDLEHFSPEGRSDIRKTLGWEDGIIILSTRSMEKIYGVETIAKAFVDLFQRKKLVRLLFLGVGSLQGEIEKIIHQAGLQEFVRFVGQVGYERLPDYYRSADLYVSASLVDGSSISLLEAMACGLPAIVSDIPGNLEWVSPGVNGWTFSVGSHRSLSDQMSLAVEAVDLRRSFGAQSRGIAEHRANWALNSEKLLQAYEMAVSDTNDARDE